jgi:hypothetical protein
MGAVGRSWFAAGVATFALAAVATAPAGAAVSFTSPVLYPAGAQTTDLVLGDFNLDGSLDVATANGSAGSVSVLSGDGQAGFAAPTVYSAGTNLTDIATGDLNGDALPDLVLADPQQGVVVWLPGLAGGSFGAAQTVQPLGPPLRVAVGDVNGDGFADIASSDFGPDSRDLSIELGNGAGGFGAPIAQTTGGADFEIALTDLNGDLRRDVVVAEGANQPRASVLLGNADGSVGPIRSFQLGEDAGGLAIADFNGDANPDIAVGHQSRVVTVLLGDGSGDFPARDDFDTVGATASSVVAADFDGDGRVDLGIGGGSFDTMRGTGSGAFEAARTHQPRAVARVAAGDLDGDGAPDVVGLAGSSVGVGGNISTKGAAPLPQPTVAKTANVVPVKGTVLVKQPGRHRFFTLTRGGQIPVGSLVDTTKGSVRLTSAAGAGLVQSGVFRGGLFKLDQKRGARPFTELRLATRLRCVSGRKPVHAGARRPRSRHLFGNAHGRFRTRGRHSIASIRGTKWLVKDTCRKTTTVALQGTVVVRDLVKHRTVTLRSGQSYVARRGNR